ncbi:hypothetical protein [Massilia sp. BHUDP2]|uniref:hypothetical protein n=1 Tax=Massilia sp. BHUDP2 TaxID=3034505 RepID=UPI003905CD9E
MDNNNAAPLATPADAGAGLTDEPCSPVQYLQNVTADVLLALRNAGRDSLAGLLEGAVKDIARMSTPGAQVTATQPELTVWYGSMPESNGKSNFTAILKRKGASMFDTDSYTFSVSEYPGRVQYDADAMRYLIGELAERPCPTNYDSEAHSGYAKPSSPAPVTAEPVAWMRDNLKECTTAASKRKMETVNFGYWGEIAKSYNIPLYAAPAPADRDAMRDAWQVLLDAGVCPGLAPMSLADGIRAALKSMERAADAKGDA